MNNHQGVPDLSAINRKVKSGAQLTAMVRSLDEQGTFDARLITAPDGTQMASPQRTDLVDAEEFVAMVVEAARVMVRDELAAFYVELVKRLDP